MYNPGDRLLNWGEEVPLFAPIDEEFWEVERSFQRELFWKAERSFFVETEEDRFKRKK